jgi:hypothetical protein
MVTSVPSRDDLRLARAGPRDRRRARPLHAVERLGLHHEHRVVVADGRLEQPFGVRRERRRDDLEPGDVRVEVLHRVRVLAADLARARVRPAEDDGAVELPAGHLPDLRRVVQDLVERDGAEVPRHELDDGPQPDHRRADADARRTPLGDGRVDDALRPPNFSSIPSLTL